MKSHDFAKHLNLMAKVLRSGPNVELDEFWFQPSGLRDGPRLNESQIPAALNALVGLNDVRKEQWLDLIDEFGLNIEIRPRDANRDIVGKLISFLAKNPDARERLKGKPIRKKAGTSAELADALNTLLK